MVYIRLSSIVTSSLISLRGNILITFAILIKIVSHITLTEQQIDNHLIILSFVIPVEPKPPISIKQILVS